VTVSIGLATTDRVGYDFAKLMKAADEALYEAKVLGRDRVADPYTATRGIVFNERLAS
jgi:PleD family two-component response regulator